MRVLRQPESTVILRWLDTKTLEVTFEGKLANPSMDFVVKNFWIEAGERVPTYALFDCTGVTAFTASIHAASMRFLAEFKSKGGREILAVVTMAPLRMFGQALVFGSGLPLKLFSSRDAAVTYLVRRLREQ
jgi:hypothetical protein